MPKEVLWGVGGGVRQHQAWDLEWLPSLKLLAITGLRRWFRT